MTCVIAIEQDGVAYIGSDSFLGTDLIRDSVDKPKFFFKGNSLVIGYAGSLRSAQIVEHSIKFRRPRKGESIDRFLVKEVVAKIRAAFAEEGLSDTCDTEFLVVCRNKIYMIQSDFSVARNAHGFLVIGSGQDFALGALAAIPKDIPPKERIEKALSIAAEFSPHVCGPFHIIEV